MCKLFWTIQTHFGSVNVDYCNFRFFYFFSQPVFCPSVFVFQIVYLEFLQDYVNLRSFV